MRCISLVLATALSISFTTSAFAQAAAPPRKAGSAAQDKPAERHQAKRKNIYDENADARKQIAASLANAKRENRRVLIQWGANWCPWCHILHDFFDKNKDVKRKLQYEYDVVLVDIGRMNKNIDLAKEYGAELKGVPYLTVLGADGKPLANQETGVLEKGPAHDPKKVMDFLTKHQAPYKTAEEILSAGLAEASRAEKKVFLHFGAPWCGWCHRFEDWMATETPTRILGADFIDVKIDIDRTVGGKEMKEKYTEGRRNGIPWFAFLDSDGTVLAVSDSSGQNLGCPYKDEEITAFIAMIEKVRRNITDDQLDALTKSLRKTRESRKSGG